MKNDIEEIVKSKIKVNTNSETEVAFSDPAFASNKIRPIHRWVPWIAGYSSEFVRDVINRFLNKPGKVLDPFAGVGTTLVEAQMMGHKTFGFEINPYAALATKVKTEAYWVDIKMLTKSIEKLTLRYNEVNKSGVLPKSTPPEGFKTRSEFYSPAVLRKVLLLQDIIEETKNDIAKDMMRLAFASTMVRYSNYSYEPSLGRRRSSGKEDILDFPVIEMIEKKLKEMVNDIIWLKSNTKGTPLVSTIFNESIFGNDVSKKIEKVDAVITSPPYLNNYHYNRNTRPQVYWLGYAKSPEDMKKLEQNNFGKYWQTVRDSKAMQLDFKLPKSDLQDVLELITKVNPDRKQYGGLGWANYAVSYFNDCNKFAKVLNKVLKPGGKAAVVLGNSIVQGFEISTDRYFGEICELNGLSLVGIEIPRAERVGNSIINSSVRITKASAGHRLYESVVILKKI